MGNKAWTMALNWSGRAPFHVTGDHKWYYSNADNQQTVGGWARSAKSVTSRSNGGSLTFLQVKEAGHMVPMDQPIAALAMINAFTQNKPFY